MSRSLAESFERVEKTMSLGATFRQTSPDRVGISAKAPQATAKEVVLKRQLSDLSKEFNALDKQHNKATTKLDEVLEEVKRLRACHDDKEKEALSLRRALERLRLDKEEESAALATDKAYICKLEAKVAAQATSLEQLEKHSALRARNKELQESVQSLHAVLASTEAELGSRNEEIEKLHIALKVRAEDLRKGGLSDSKPSLLLELANEQQERMNIALKLAETVQENNKQHEQIEILAERLKAKTAECERTAKEADDKYRTLRQETQKQLHAFENEVADLKTRVQDREARTVDLRTDLREARAERQRLQESLQREQQNASERSAHIKEGERRLADEQARVKQLTAALAAATQAAEEARKTAKHNIEEHRVELAAAVQKETKRTEEAKQRIAELEDDLEDCKRQMHMAVSMAKKEAVSDLEKTRARASEDLARARKQMLADHEQVVKQLTKDVDGIRRALAAETEKVAEREHALADLRRREQEAREEISGLHAELDHFTEVNGEIQSDAQAEQRQRLREEKRASAFAHQVASLEAQLTSVRKEKAASDSALKVKLEEALEELRATIEERDQAKRALQETKSKTLSSSTNHSTLVAENRQLRQQAEELARAKAAAQKAASDAAAGLRVKLEQAQVQVREWEAAAARLESKNERLQALVDAERKGSAALAKQCTSALRALHTTSPPHRAPDYARARSSDGAFAAASEGAVRRSPPETVEPILLNSEARDLELGSEGRNSAPAKGIASRFYDSIDVGDAWTRHVSVEGTFGRPVETRRTEWKSYGSDEQVKQVVVSIEPRYERRPDSRAETPAFSDAPSDGLKADPDALTREMSGDDVAGVEIRSRRTSRRASAGGMSVSENGMDEDRPEQGRPNALEALLNDFDVDNASADGESSRRFSRNGRASGMAESAGMKKPALSLEDLADLAEPYSPPVSDGGASEGNGEPYEMGPEDSESWKQVNRIAKVAANGSSRPASSLGLETERSHIPDDDDEA
ncbi:hypothetical protein KFL_000550260 [Klebsormidium nitens]|uniref:Uncharacterized protein n=1 Tax=Klebsormidium nitens TaxID=105231 RepID=A0A1Y1HVD8_KLENI|nr:hypothetical protein KFL_000550260 [Klebsormidium nitens]|eukprot:GAQ80496.1 hypothetical protein KFL_000550260 [Klebsormidium nitens]